MSYGYVTNDNGFTIEGWFWRDAVPNNWAALVNQQTQASPNWTSNVTLNGRHFFFGFETGTGKLNLQTFTEAGTQRINWTQTSADFAADSTWHHWAIRMATDKTTVDVFIDGLLYVTVVGTGSVGTWNPGILCVGGSYAPHLGNWGQLLYDKRLAYVAATNKVLSANRIYEHYAAGAGGTVWYGETEVGRLNHLYDMADVPIQSRIFDPAITTLQGIEVAGNNALEKVHETTFWARGYVFADGQTNLDYHNRQHRYNRWVAATLAESLGSAIEVGAELVVDTQNIYNDIRGSKPFGSTIRVVNEVSKSAYGRKTYDLELGVVGTEELRNAITWLISRYGRDRLRINGVSIRAESSAALERIATGGVQIGDVLVLDELPENSPIGQMEFAIEGMNLDVSFKNQIWKMNLALSPHELNKVYQIGVSDLGDGSALAY